MSLKYKFDKLNENDPERKAEQGNADASEDIERYDSASNVRNLIIVDLEGKHFFWNYNGLVNGAFVPEKNSITLEFATHVVKLKGRNLETLFESIIAHMIKRIVCVDERYIATKGETDIFVSEITIGKVS